MNGSRVVIDASITARLLMPDQLSDACWSLLDSLVEAGHQITMPALWAYEVTSSLTKAVSFAVLTIDEARTGLAQISLLGAQLIAPDAEQNRRAFEWTVRLKRSAAYDSYYLALAETFGCELWTADRRLFNAARAAQLDRVHWVEENR
jgi:predicted nucleic acid-binding protein